MPAAYRSTRRRRQAQATRQDIVRAARRLFAQRGYAATSVAHIAAEADVAVQTIYASVGSKRELVLALIDAIDEEAGIPELTARLGSAESPREIIGLAVRLTRQLSERCGDIVDALTSAAAVESDAATAAAEGMRRHRAGAARVAARLERLHALRDGIPTERAAAVMAVLTSRATYAQLTGDHGWSFEECERWIERTLDELLLREP